MRKAAYQARSEQIRHIVNNRRQEPRAAYCEGVKGKVEWALTFAVAEVCTCWVEMRGQTCRARRKSVEGARRVDERVWVGDLLCGLSFALWLCSAQLKCLAITPL